MTASQQFKATMPFVRLKLLLSLAPYIIKVTALTILAFGISGVLPQMTDGASYIELEGFSFIIAPAVLLLIVLPLTSIILRYFGRYIVRVGHISALVRIRRTGKVPRKQISWGMRNVKRRFASAAMFFILDRLVSRAILELQGVMRNMLSGLGFLVLFINLFKRKFLKYIDECLIAYGMLVKDTSMFRGIVVGVVVFARGWVSMAKAALRAMLTSLLISLVFYILTGLIVYLGITHGSVVIIGAGVALFFFVGIIKRCVVDSYCMIVMLNAFLQEVKRQGKINFSGIAEIAHMSPGYRELVRYSNQQDKFLSNEQLNELHPLVPHWGTGGLM